MESDFDRKVALILAGDKRYDAKAYRFVAEAVTYTVSRCGAHRHVSAQELLEGARQLAFSKFGRVAVLVLAGWGIKLDDDIGAVVYLLIGVGLLGESKDDSPEDFKTGQSFFPEMPPVRSIRSKTDKLPFID